jgi:hypothetical protein
MILLNRVTSLLLFTICSEEWAFVRGRLDGDEAAVTLIPALGLSSVVSLESAFIRRYFSLLLTVKSTISLLFPIETILIV